MTGNSINALMISLENIEIEVESASFHQNALPVLHEIRHALARLLESGEETVIDLSAIPFGPGDEERLLQVLGEGEVKATIHALGPTRVWETAYPGIWLVDYLDPDEARVTVQIEVTHVPSLLHSQPEDLADSLVRLEEQLLKTKQQPS